MGADSVGFIMAPSSRQLSVDEVGHIIKRIPPEIITVGVFKDELKENVVKIVNKLGLSGAQLHGHETKEETQWIAQRVQFVIKAFKAGQPMVREFFEYGADALLLDSHAPGSGQVFDWSLAEDVEDNSRLILSGGLTPENVIDGIVATKPWGVDVSTGVEKAPGIKDPVKVKKFIEAARSVRFEDSVGSNDKTVFYDWSKDVDF
jgi:phosphoribosylanthranilate isomerase